MPVERKYPFYVISVDRLLALERWVPHQVLLSQGALVDLSDEEDARVAFVSHQWTGFGHPDPSGAQLRHLQRVVRRLRNGELDVNNHMILELIYGFQECTTAEEWTEKLGGGFYFWIDYLSIPQPAAEGEQPKSWEPTMAEPSPGHAGTAAGNGHAPLEKRCSDHRLGASEVAAQLTAAVDSIPAFITACSEMWVLTPPVQHCDQGDVCCDFNTWRTRGWCRMEFAASKLATGDDKPVMLIGSPSAIENDEGLEYFQPCDIVKLSVAQGTFTQESDRPKVNKTIKAMLVTKLDAYEKSGNYTLMRLLLAFAPAFLPPEDAADLTLKKKTRRPSEDSAPASAIDELKRRVRWRGDVAEAAWQNTSGWSLLTLAAALDDLAAVQELLRLPNAKAMLRAKGKAHSVPGHETFNKILHDYSTHITPLVAAATLASVPVLEALLDAGADMKGDAQYVFGEDACHLRGCVIAGKVENTKYLLTRYPEYVSSVPSFAGFGPLNFATEAGFNQYEMVQMLLSLGADVNKRVSMGFTVVQWASIMYDLDPRVIGLLKDAGADITEPFKFSSPIMVSCIAAGLHAASKVAGALQLKATSAQLKAGHSGMTKMRAMFGGMEGGTVLHGAASRNDLRLAKELLAVGADPAVRDAQGRTALGVVKEKYGADAMATHLFEKVLGPDKKALAERRAQRERARRGGGGGGATWAVVAVAAATVAGGALLMARRRR